MWQPIVANPALWAWLCGSQKTIVSVVLTTTQDTRGRICSCCLQYLSIRTRIGKTCHNWLMAALAIVCFELPKLSRKLAIEIVPNTLRHCRDSDTENLPHIVSRQFIIESEIFVEQFPLDPAVV